MRPRQPGKRSTSYQYPTPHFAHRIRTVVSRITSVTTSSLVDSDARAGQSVMLAAQLVIV